MAPTCKPGFRKSGTRCIRKPLRASGFALPSKLRVFYDSPTNFGYEKSDIKMFNTKDKAHSYALTLVKDLKKSAKETDDNQSVRIEDLMTGRIIEAWENEGEGRVEHYPGGYP